MIFSPLSLQSSLERLEDIAIYIDYFFQSKTALFVLSIFCFGWFVLKEKKVIDS